MHLNIRDFPDDLHSRITERVLRTKSSLKDFVIGVCERALAGRADGRVEPEYQVDCPLCGLSGPLLRFGDNAQCWHCGCQFLAPGEVEK